MWILDCIAKRWSHPWQRFHAVVGRCFLVIGLSDKLSAMRKTTINCLRLKSRCNSSRCFRGLPSTLQTMPGGQQEPELDGLARMVANGAGNQVLFWDLGGRMIWRIDILDCDFQLKHFWSRSQNLQINMVMWICWVSSWVFCDVQGKLLKQDSNMFIAAFQIKLKSFPKWNVSRVNSSFGNDTEAYGKQLRHWRRAARALDLWLPCHWSKAMSSLPVTWTTIPPKHIFELSCADWGTNDTNEFGRLFIIC